MTITGPQNLDDYKETIQNFVLLSFHSHSLSLTTSINQVATKLEWSYSNHQSFVPKYTWESEYYISVRWQHLHHWGPTPPCIPPITTALCHATHSCDPAGSALGPPHPQWLKQTWWRLVVCCFNHSLGHLPALVLSCLAPATHVPAHHHHHVGGAANRFRGWWCRCI